MTEAYPLPEEDFHFSDRARLQAQQRRVSSADLGQMR